MTTTTAPTLADIEAARERLGGRARVTPVYGSETFCADRRHPRLAEGGEPPAHRLVQDPRRRQQARPTLERGRARRGRVAASAGNHGQAVAWAARELGIAATVFMPQDAPMAKVEATRNYGADTVLTGAIVRRRAGRGANVARRRDGRDVRARVRGSRGDRGARDDRARARRAAARRAARSSSRSAAAGSPPGSRSRCARSARACESSASRQARRATARSPTASR